MPAFPPDQWLVQQVRFTGFLTEKPPATAESWWKDLVGQEPEARITKPRHQTIEEVGACEAPGLGPKQCRLILMRAAQRIDWRLGAREADATSLFPGEVGPLPIALDALVGFVTKWLGTAEIPAMSRIALGIAGQHPEPSAPACLEQLKNFLPSVTIDPAGSGDLLYQVNRWRTSNEIPGLRLNRLSKWSVGVTQFLEMTDPGVAATPSFTHFVSFEFDLNTDATRKGPIEKDRVGPLLAELKGLALELAKDGEKP